MTRRRAVQSANTGIDGQDEMIETSQNPPLVSHFDGNASLSIAPTSSQRS